MNVHHVPQDNPSIIILGTQAYAAANSIGVLIGLEQNTGLKIGLDLHHVIGLTGPTPIIGTQDVLNAKRDAVTAARQTRRLHIADGLAFCARTVDLLKIRFGRRWNPRWQAVGLSRNTLVIPANPLTMLLEFRGYFGAHPEHELVDAADPSQSITAARAHACAMAIQAAVHAESVANSERNQAAEDRDNAIAALTRRMSGLRAEMKQLLSPDDPRWRNFGFSRPVDRRTPPVVTGLSLRPGGIPGEIIAEWVPSVGAENYRVLRQVLTVDLQPIEFGLRAEPTAIIPGLPSGKSVAVTVTARNEAGESLPVTATIVVS